MFEFFYYGGNVVQNDCPVQVPCAPIIVASNGVVTVIPPVVYAKKIPAPEKLAPERFAFRRLVPKSDAPERFALLRFAPVNPAKERLADEMVAP